MTEKVIVIGAGMAGIMAARTLHDAGLDVTVLEARERIGGRTHTDHSLGGSVDLGAAWIHGIDGNPLTPLAQKLGVEYGYTDFLNRSVTAVQAYDEDGTPLDQAEYALGQQHALAGWYLAAGSILYAAPTSVKSLQDWLDFGLPKPEGLSFSAEKGYLYQSLISTEYVCAADAHEIDWQLNEQQVGLTGGDYLLHGGGYSVISDHLAEGLDIRTGHAVTQVTVTEDGVTVTTSSPTDVAKKEEIACSRVVVSVPLGVLKSGAITFEPPLPDAKCGAIERIGFGNYEKLAMRFDKFYWPREAQRFNYMSTGDLSLFHAWLNIGYYTGEPILVSYHAGKRARHLNQLSDGDLIERTVAVMQRMFGGDIPAPLNYARTRWQHDPFSQGSYSFDQIGQQSGDRNALAQPVENRLFFAGEATHPHFHSTVHGAYETGVRAAREILQQL